MQAASTDTSVVVGKFSGGYWQQSRRPLTALAFVTPLLIIYEVGVVWLGPHAMRNGADVWLRQLLDWLGFSQYFLLPFLTLSLLAGWHYVTREPWRISPSVLYTKLTECVLLAVALVVVARIQANLQALVTREPPPAVLHAALGSSLSSIFRRWVSFFGGRHLRRTVVPLNDGALTGTISALVRLPFDLVVGRARRCCRV